MIFTAMGEPVEIVGGPMMNLLDPSTADDNLVEVRSLNDPNWRVQRRLSELKADGGIHEIDAAIKQLATK